MSKNKKSGRVAGLDRVRSDDNVQVDFGTPKNDSSNSPKHSEQTLRSLGVCLNYMI